MMVPWLKQVFVTIVISLCCLLSLSSGQTSEVTNPVSPTSDGKATASDLVTDDGGSALAKGVQPLYEMTYVFLGDVVQPNRVNSYFNISDLFDGSLFTDPSTTWKSLAEYLVGFVVCAVIGLLFIIILPLVGLIFCCCRLCGRCGGKAGSHDPKRAKCKRLTFGVVLTIINTLILAGAVCMFFTNELIHQQLSDTQNGAISKVQNSVEKLEKYINDSYDGLQENTLKAYDDKIWSPSPELGKGLLIQEIKNTAADALDELLEQVNVTDALNKAQVLATEVNNTQDSLLAVEESLDDLTNSGNTLHDNLTDIRTEVEKILSDRKCNQTACRETLLIVKNLSLQANFSKLDRLKTISSKVRQNVHVQRGVNAAEKKINELKTSAKDKIKNQITEAENTARQIRGEIESSLQEVENGLQKAKLPPETEKSFSDAKQYTVEYGKYWWYGGIGVSCVVLLIVVFTYFGVLYGFCGERPGEDTQCCNWGVGANLLMAGVGFSFIFSWLLMIVTIVLFIPGGVTYTELCRYLNSHNPQDLQVLDPLTDMIGLSKLLNTTDKNLTLATILRECQEDKGIYEALQLKHLFDLDKYLDLTAIDKAVDEISGLNIAVGNLTVPPELIDQLRNFGNVGFENINISEYEEQIDQNLTTVDLYKLASQIEAVGNNLENNSPPGDLQMHNYPAQFNRTLHGQAARLRNVSDDLIVKMKQQVMTLKDAVGDLKKKMNMKNVTEDLITAITKAETYFNTNGQNKFDSILPEEIKRVRDSVKLFTGQVYKQITEDVGKCRPVYDAVYGASDAACLDVINNLNGFWFSLGWCLFFFIPSIIIAVKLAGLNRKEEEYVPGIRNLEEPVQDIYSNGETHSDTIPLTSVNKVGRPDRNGGMPNTGYHRDEYGQKSSYDGAGYGGRGPSYQAGDGYNPEGRGYPRGGYAAPSHLRYPNGMSSDGYPGPPRDPPYF